MNTNDIGKLILRASISILMLMHGYNKLFFGIAKVKSIFANSILPDFLSYGVYIGEILAPLMILVGYKSRVAGIIMSLHIIIILYLIQTASLLAIKAKGGGFVYELEYLFLFGAITVSLLGSGKPSISGGKGRWD